MPSYPRIRLKQETDICALTAREVCLVVVWILVTEIEILGDFRNDGVLSARQFLEFVGSIHVSFGRGCKSGTFDMQNHALVRPGLCVISEVVSSPDRSRVKHPPEDGCGTFLDQFLKLSNSCFVVGRSYPLIAAAHPRPELPVFFPVRENQEPAARRKWGTAITASISSFDHDLGTEIAL